MQLERIRTARMNPINIIDTPSANALADPLALRIEGWVHAASRHDDLVAVEVLADGELLGQTAFFFIRPDVNEAHSFLSDTRTGFSVLLSAPSLFRREFVTLGCRIRFSDGSFVLGATRTIQVIDRDYRSNDYGVLARPDETRLFHRSDIYTSGASVSEINPECLTMLRRYLPEPPSHVLDVGCGFGGYGRALLDAGYDWLGVEVKASDCDELARRNLPHRQVDGRTLPFADRAFESTICIEVLEHIAEPAGFLSEIARVTGHRCLISVPNLELIPYLHPYRVVPWHLLEGDHKNFFTRASLRGLLSGYFRKVEILTYAPLPVRTPEGLPLDNHLFAICEN